MATVHRPVNAVAENVRPGEVAAIAIGTLGGSSSTAAAGASLAKPGKTKRPVSLPKKGLPDADDDDDDDEAVSDR